MFQRPSNLKALRDELSEHLDLPEYFLGMHAFFDGDVIFARDVVQVNLDLPPFPIDFNNIWDWFRDQLRGPAGQETFAYELGFDVEGEQDSSMEELLSITKGTSMTIWMIDLAHQETPTEGRRFVIVTVPDKPAAKDFRERYHGRHVGVDLEQKPRSAGEEWTSS